MEFYQILRKLRAEAKLSGEELGEAIALDKSSISRLEKGETTPKSSTLIALAKYFNVSIDYLLGQENIKNPYKNILVNQDEFAIAFSNLQDELTEEDKKQILKIAQFLAEENKKN